MSTRSPLFNTNLEKLITVTALVACLEKGRKSSKLHVTQFYWLAKYKAFCEEGKKGLGVFKKMGSVLNVEKGNLGLGLLGRGLGSKFIFIGFLIWK